MQNDKPLVHMTIAEIADKVKDMSSIEVMQWVSSENITPLQARAIETLHDHVLAVQQAKKRQLPAVE